MTLTRFGFSLVVMVWLLPMLGIDIYGNTTSTGLTSELYYYSALFHGLLAMYTAYQLVRPDATMSKHVAQGKVDDPEDAIVSFKSLGAAEFVYCGVLSVAACVAWWFHHTLNKDSTGVMSLVSLVWSWLDIVIAGLSGLQFYRLKSGSIVEVAQKIFQK